MLPLIHLTSEIAIPTYYLVISLVTCICLFWLHKRQKSSDLPRNIVLDLSLILMVTGFIGSRLFHVFFESWDYYKAAPKLILHFWDGGFVFFGGAILAAAAAWFFLRFKDPEHTLYYFDLFAPITSLAYCLGRLGCLMAGCCYGKACDLPWAIDGKHPTQIYASLWELGVVFILIGMSSTKASERRPKVLRKPGAVFFVWLILHGIGRILMESFRDDFRGPIWGMSISSWISIALICLGAFLLVIEPEEKK